MSYEGLRDRLSRASPADWPTWRDLESDRVVEDSQVLQDVQNRLNRFRFCVIVGPEGRGKSSVARLLGYKCLLRGLDALHLDASESDDEDLRGLAHAIRHFDHQARLYIIENVQDIEFSGGWSAVIQAAIRSSNSMFLFTERSAAGESVFESLELAHGGHQLVRRDLEVRLKPTANLIEEIIKNHFARNPKKRVLPSATGYTGIVNRCGGNLRVLSAYLDAWEDGDLATLPEEHVLEDCYRRRIAGLDPGLHLSLIRLSAINQFGIGVLGRALDEDALETLTSTGLVGRFFRDLDTYYRLPHSSDAGINVRAWAHVQRQDPSAIAETALGQYAEYLRTQRMTEQLRFVLVRLQGHGSVFRRVLSLRTVQHAVVAGFEQALDRAPLAYITKTLAMLKDFPVLQLSISRIVSDRGSEWLAGKMRLADQDEVSSATRVLGGIDMKVASAAEDLLTPEDWRTIWLRLPLRRLSGFLWRYAESPEVHWHTEQARVVIAKLTQQEDLGERLRNLSYESAGKLLRVARKLNPTAAESLARIVAQTTGLASCTEPHALTLILKEMRQLGNMEAHRRLLLRILEEVPGEVFYKYTDGSGRPLQSLTYDLQLANGIAAVTGVDGYLRSLLWPGIAEQLHHWRPETISHFLWNCRVIDKDEILAWLRAVGYQPFVQLLSQPDSPLEAFRVLWNVWLIDQSICREVCVACRGLFERQFWPDGHLAGPEVIPVLGLYMELQLPHPDPCYLPEPEHASAALTNDPSATVLLAALECYEVLEAAKRRAFAAYIASDLSLKGTSLEALAARNPLDELRQLYSTKIKRLGASDSDPNSNQR